MHRKAKRVTACFLIATVAPLVVGFAALFAYDPLQIYHLPWGRPLTLHSNMRLQAVGAIRHRSFDSVILGTSMTENTSADEASVLLGGHFVNLSLTAADFFERALILDYLFRRKSPKQILYTVDHIYINSRKGYPHFPLSTFDFLYDRNPFNDVRAYLNTHFGACLLRWSHDPDCIGSNVGLDRPNAWYAQPDYAKRFGGFDKWCESKDNYQIGDVRKLVETAVEEISIDGAKAVPKTDRDANVMRAIQYVEDNVVRHVREHPDVRFVFIFPPYFRATYAIWLQARPMHSAIHLAVIRHFAHLSSELDNMEVFGFEDAAFLDDIANYKDLGHYRPAFDSQILQAIASKKHRLTDSNVDAYIDQSLARAKAFNLRDLKRQVDSCFDSSLPVR
jgi:hypothetical protein